MKLFSGNTTVTTPAIATRKMISEQFGLLRQKKQLLTIFILLFICMLGWAIVVIFSSQKASKIDPSLTALSKPLTPTVDTQVLNSLETKRSFTDDELSNFTIYRTYTDPKTQEEKIIDINQAIPSATTSN